MTNTTAQQSAAEALVFAEARVRELKAQVAAEAEATRNRVKPVWAFTAIPSPHRYDKIYDDSVTLWYISGEVVNADEVKAVGHPDHMLRGGGMNFYFNMATGKIIGGTGGGTTWGHVMRKIDAIGTFIAANPEGGDITPLVGQPRKGE